MQLALQPGVPVTTLDGVVTGSSAVYAVPTGIQRLTALLTAVGTVSAGKVKLEGSSDPSYSGAWALIGSEVTLVSDSELSVTSTAYFPFVRVRVSTDITGGAALTAVLVGSN